MNRDEVAVLAPTGGTIAGQPVFLSADPPSWDFRDLADLLPGVDRERANVELNAIYLAALQAELAERVPTAKETRRQLTAVRNAVIALGGAGRSVLGRELRRSVEEHGAALLPLSDHDLSLVLLQAVLRAPGAELARPRGQRGIGARMRHALLRLVELHQAVTGGGTPYRRRDGSWRHGAAFAFAHRCLSQWNLARPSDTPSSLALCWQRARHPAKRADHALIVGTACDGGKAAMVDR